MTDDEIRLKVLELVMKFGSHLDQAEPMKKAENIYKWVVVNKRQPGRPKKSK